MLHCQVWEPLYKALDSRWSPASLLIPSLQQVGKGISLKLELITVSASGAELTRLTCRQLRTLGQQQPKTLLQPSTSSALLPGHSTAKPCRMTR